MRTNTVHAVAVALGLGVCTVAQAQSSYTAPSKWNNFRVAADSTEKVPAPTADLPAPSLPQYAPPIAPQPVESMSTAVGTGCAPCESDNFSGSPYSQAMSSSWDGATAASCGANCAAGRPPLNPWFGSANLLFYSLANGRGRAIMSGDIYGGVVRSSIVDPNWAPGFDIGVGRYFGCGKYGVGVNYFNWNPGSQTEIVNTDLAGVPIAAGGGLRSDMIGYNDVLGNLDFGGGPLGSESIYDIINGSGAYAGATGVRLTRDLSFQGVEANVFCFGLMGAQRAAYAGCNSGSCFGAGGNTGFGGAAGPMIRPCGGRVRIMAGHGFRWFQVKDSFEAAMNIDGSAGYQAQDLYDRTEVENNLFGYQFGGMLNYCLSCRWNMNIGGKFGVYGNRVNYNHRLGTETSLAYLTAAGTDDINVESSDTVLAGLGELDMGLGYRINDAWSVRGGYRVLAICGVADAVENTQNTDYRSLATVGAFDANDCYILHGAYVGLTYNW